MPRFKEAVSGSGVFSLIGVYDMLSAVVAAQHFEGIFVSGFGFSASHYGLPDAGFIAWPDVIAFAQRLRTILPHHYLLVDIDDGYGGPEMAAHVVRNLQAIGTSGVILEDQARPRRFGHLPGKRILSLDEYLEKLTTVLRVRDAMTVVARTDATKSAEIIRRVRAFAAAGADGVLIAGLTDLGLLRSAREAIGDKYLLFDQASIGGSRFPSLAELAGHGVDVAIYSTTCLGAAYTAIDRTLATLAEQDGRISGLPGTTAIPACMALLSRSIDPHGHIGPGLAARPDPPHQ